MLQNKVTLVKFLIGNLLQALLALGLVLIFFFFENFLLGLLVSLIWIYLVPPFVTRIAYFFLSRPEGKMDIEDKKFWAWYIGAQLQSIFLRFHFLEELLRVFPLLYSAWLRLWGAQIGKRIYWAPGVYIMDRTHLKIDDFVLVGYGAGFTSHHLNLKNGKFELILATPHVEANAVIGGLSGVGPGAVVASGESLPSTMYLAPFYRWKDGRRHSALPRE